MAIKTDISHEQHLHKICDFESYHVLAKYLNIHHHSDRRGNAVTLLLRIKMQNTQNYRDCHSAPHVNTGIDFTCRLPSANLKSDERETEVCRWEGKRKIRLQ